jgi:hypothetical protein
VLKQLLECGFTGSLVIERISVLCSESRTGAEKTRNSSRCWMQSNLLLRKKMKKKKKARRISHRRRRRQQPHAVVAVVGREKEREAHETKTA